MAVREPHLRDLAPVILAGGSGTRLWPVSRAALPKHLVALFGEETLIQATARRLLRVAPAERVVTVAAAGQAGLVRRQLEALDPALARHLLLEPVARNTAAAVGLAALHAERQWGAGALLWVCPSDHLIQRPEPLLEALAVGAPAARAGCLVTFGIAAARPETGFGWIEAGDALATAPGVRAVRRFVEKPRREVAEGLLAAGCLWNSGMFLMRADSVLAELRRHEPALAAGLAAAHAAMVAAGAAMPPEALFAALPALPIDKAVMERSDRVAVVPCDPGWSDIGSWRALWELSPHDGAGNAASGDVWLDAAGGNLVRAEHRLVALAGVQDLAVVETADAVLVAGKDAAEPLRAIVAALATAGRPEALVHCREAEPWGFRTRLHAAPGLRVTELAIDPGAELVGGHAAHWVVVAGEAEVTQGGATGRHRHGDAVAVPQGGTWRLRNAGDGALRLVEVRLDGP